MDYKGDSEFISERIKTKLEPIPDFEMEIERIEDKVILVLTVFPGENTPYFYVDSGSRIAFKKIGNQSVPVNNMDLLNLTLKGQKRSYDSLPSELNVEDVSFQELKNEYKRRSGKTFEETDLESFGLVTKQGKLTIAGALFADGHQLYQSRVFCTRWNGLNKTHGLIEALDDKEFEGNLLYLLDASLRFVKMNTRKMWRKGKVYREEFVDYPERALQEAIVNALVHRDYSIVGSEVHIDIYDDRLEVYSPGGMYDGTFIQDHDLKNIASLRRNPLIADVMSRMDLMERRGSGLRKIIESYEKEKNFKQGLEPEFRSTENAFFTLLKNLNYDYYQQTTYDVLSEGRSEGQNEGQSEGQTFSPQKRRESILYYMRLSPDITAQLLSQKLNVSISTIERDIKRLKDDGLVQYTGSAKSGVWTVKTKEKKRRSNLDGKEETT